MSINEKKNLGRGDEEHTQKMASLISTHNNNDDERKAKNCKRFLRLGDIPWCEFVGISMVIWGPRETFLSYNKFKKTQLVVYPILNYRVVDSG